MTRATIHVQIPRPCGEAWEAMTPTAQGRHCAACQHTVTDFTQRTDAEILAQLRQAAGGRVCGRFRAEQLDRALVHAPAAAPRWRAWVLAAAALGGLLPTAARSQELRGSHSGGPVPAGGSRAATQQLPATNLAPAGTTPDAPVVTPEESRPAARAAGRISGRVIDQASGEGLPGVTVLLRGTKYGVSTGLDGRFEGQLPLSDSATLVIASIGYQTQYRRLSQYDGRPLHLELKMETLWMGEVVITRYPGPWYSPRTWWSQLRALPRRLTGRG
ncbi:carboxypeptidase-like regulatory domain-containing protein [Hymenobacter edaphi]|uniref:Carboxypeptidase-like regulatory domain-containing protein n=1 Tax=Hymenobacter edaphi TaxID=2211146 RepID=A0A328B7S3_9BACT|nr:carboxypeptidase-like regulatory domain-containing protein [Hymenobacter edaphi]RAK62695.1 hypothetical protein DLM85_22775 [Hymenobacter edaphi]